MAPENAPCQGKGRSRGQRWLAVCPIEAWQHLQANKDAAYAAVVVLCGSVGALAFSGGSSNGALLPSQLGQWQPAD